MKGRGSTPSNGWRLSLLIALAVTACQPPAPLPTRSTSTPTPARPPSTAQPKIRPPVPAEALQGTGIQVWHPWLGVEASLLESQVAEFNQDNEWGITVRASGHTGFTELYNGVTSALAGEEAPHLVIALPEHATGWYADGYVTDLADYVGDSAYGLGDEETGDVPQAFWRQELIEGIRVGVPAQRSARFLIYNRTWARQLGFAEAPQTEAEFRQQACSAHESLTLDGEPGNDGMGGWLVDTDPVTFLSWMVAFDGGVLEGSGYRFLSPRNLEAATSIKQLYDDGCAWLPQGAGEPAAAFANRSALFATSGLEELSEYARALAAAENADSWTVMSFPGPDESGLITYGSTFVVLKSSPEQQLAAWLFVRWLLSPESQARWVQATGLFPLRMSAVALLSEYSRSHPQWTAALEYIPEVQTQPQLESWRQVRVMLGDGFDAMFRSNTPAGRVAEILAIMDRTASDLAQ